MSTLAIILFILAGFYVLGFVAGTAQHLRFGTKLRIIPLWIAMILAIIAVLVR